MTNTTNTLSFIAVTLLLSACSSATTVSGDNEDVGEAGSAGADVSPTGGSGNAVAPGSGGIIVAGAPGTGGVGNTTGGTAETGGTETGGIEETGGINTNTGGTETGGQETGGTGGGVCVPKTCLTIAVELAGGQTDPLPDACGLVDDGCGNLIDCGGCEGVHPFCGGGSLGSTASFTQGTELDDGVPHLCGGGCAPSELNTSGAGVCMSPERATLILCSRDAEEMDSPPTELIGNLGVNDCIMEGRAFCCTNLHAL